MDRPYVPRVRQSAALCLAGIVTILSLIVSARPASAAPLNAPSVAIAGTTSGGGYWFAAADGGVFAYGDARFFGSMAGRPVSRPIVGIARTPDSAGYWLTAADGGVFAFGDAQFVGSMANRSLAQPIVGIASTPDGRGYWLVSADGGVFAFGDARFFGSVGGNTLNRPVVGMTPTSDGNGYWLAAADGGVFAFGDARFLGSMVGRSLSQPVVGITATPSGEGYSLVATDGGVFAFGNARFLGSMGGKPLAFPVVGVDATPSGAGYWLVAADGGVFAFGDAGFFGSHGGQGVAQPPSSAGFHFPFADPGVVVPPRAWTQDQGVDIATIAGRCGSNAVEIAVADGQVIQEGISGFGPAAPVLRIEAGPLAGRVVYYGHAKPALVPVGAHVRGGDPIAQVGCGIVGNSTGPHLEIGISRPGSMAIPAFHQTAAEMYELLVSSYNHQ